MIHFRGSGSYAECASAIRECFNKTICTSSSCSFDNIYQPKPISPSIRFVAISAWYSTFNSLAPNVSLAPNQDENYDLNFVNLSQIKTAIAAICNQQWSHVPNPDRYRPCRIKYYSIQIF